MRVCDVKVPLFIDEWFANFDAPKQIIRSSNLAFELLSVGDQDPAIRCLDLASEHPIHFVTTDTLIPKDIKEIFGFFSPVYERDFPSAGNLYQLVRLIRFCQSKRHSVEAIFSLLRKISLPNFSIWKHSTARNEVNGLISNLNPNNSIECFELPQADLEWILRMKYEQNKQVRTPLRSTGSNYIITLDDDCTGMASVGHNAQPI